MGDAQLPHDPGPTTPPTLASDAWDIRTVRIVDETPTELVVGVQTGSLSVTSNISIPAGVFYLEFDFRLAESPVRYRARAHSNYNFASPPEIGIELRGIDGTLCLRADANDKCFIQRFPVTVDAQRDEILLHLAKEALVGRGNPNGFWTNENPGLPFLPIGGRPETLKKPPKGTLDSIEPGMVLRNASVRVYPRGDWPANWHDDTSNASPSLPYTFTTGMANGRVGFLAEGDGSGIEVGGSRLLIITAFNQERELRTLQLRAEVVDSPLWWVKPGGGAHFRVQAPSTIQVRPNGFANVPVLVHADNDALRQHALLRLNAAVVEDSTLFAVGDFMIKGAVTPTADRPMLYLHSRPSSVQEDPIVFALCEAKFACLGAGWYNALERDPWPGQEDHAKAAGLPSPAIDFLSGFAFGAGWARNPNEDGTLTLNVVSPLEVPSGRIDAAWSQLVPIPGTNYLEPKVVAAGSATTKLAQGTTKVDVPLSWQGDQSVYGSDEVPNLLQISFPTTADDPAGMLVAAHPDDYRIRTEGSWIRLPMAKLPVRVEGNAGPVVMDARLVDPASGSGDGVHVPAGGTRLVNVTLFNTGPPIDLEASSDSRQGGSIKAHQPGPWHLATNAAMTVTFTVSPPVVSAGEKRLVEVNFGPVGRVVVEFLIDQAAPRSDLPVVLVIDDEAAVAASKDARQGTPAPGALILGLGCLYAIRRLRAHSK